MKKFLCVLVITLFVCSFAYAGKEVIAPSALQLNSDKIELIQANFKWGVGDGNTCRVTYRVWNNDRSSILREIIFDITSTSFNDLVSGFGATLESRLETEIWQDIQRKFELVP